MRFSLSTRFRSGFTVLESLCMIGLMTVMALVGWAIYLKESDPERKGPGVWEQMDSPFIPAFREADSPVQVVPDPPSEVKIGEPQ